MRLSTTRPAASRSTILPALVERAGPPNHWLGAGVPWYPAVVTTASRTTESIACSLASGLSSVMPVPSGWTGSLLECVKAVAGLKVIPGPPTLKGRLAAWLNFSGAARSRPVP